MSNKLRMGIIGLAALLSMALTASSAGLAWVIAAHPDTVSEIMLISPAVPTGASGSPATLAKAKD